MNFISDMQDLDLKEVFWGDIKNRVAELNPELASICDNIENSNEQSLYLIRYPYGAKIVDKGVFNLPTVDGDVISIKDAKLSTAIKEKLSYCPIPLSLILHNNNEVLIEANNRVIPLNYFTPGEMFGIFESINALMGSYTEPEWTVTAGARSVVMLPKITDKMGHSKIKKEFGIHGDVPVNFIDHWGIFKEICTKTDDSNKWYNEILVFPSSWFIAESNSTPWLKFQKYLFKVNWKQSKLLRDVVNFGLLWSSFVKAIDDRRLKPRPYIVDTIKHLVSIGNSSGVTFKPTTDESALPASLIQKAYTEVYNLKTYIPTIMQPCKLNGADKKGYYSLSFPTTLETTPYVKNAPNIIEDERDIKLLISILQKTMQRKQMFANTLENVKYEFFHTDVDRYGEILNSRDIALEDNRFNYAKDSDLMDRVFCSTSHFFRGCIRISFNSDS